MKIMRLFFLSIYLFSFISLYAQIKSTNELMMNGVPVPDDDKWIVSTANPNGNISCTTVDGADLYIGGSFTTIGGITANRIAKYNTLTGVWSALVDGSGKNGVSGGAGTVWRIFISGNKIFIGGQFTNIGAAGGVSEYNNVCYFDKSNNTWYTMNHGVDAGAWAFAVKGNDVYVGGAFTWAGEEILLSKKYPQSKSDAKNTLIVSPWIYIAKWNMVSNEWSTLGRGMSGGSQVSTVLLDGDLLYVVGAFVNAVDAAGNPIANTKCIALWNTASSTWSSVGSGLNVGNRIADIIKVNGNFYVAGDFTQVGGVNANYCAKWNGANWSALGGGLNNLAYGLTSKGSDIFFGGEFTRVNELISPINANRVAKWDGTNWYALGSGIDNWTHWALTFVGYNLYVGGSFANAGGKASSRLAIWQASSPPIVTTPVSQSSIINSNILGATVTADGGYPITERGIVYSTSMNPSILHNKITTNGTLGSYTLNASGLSPNVLYHYRGYATNEIGTGYTDDATFTINFLPPVLISPENNSTNIDVNTLLSWNSANFARTYRIQISNSPDMSNPLYDGEVTGLSYFTDYLNFGTIYYWRVQSRSTPYESAWSEIWKLTTKSAGVVIYNPTTGILQNSLRNFGTVNSDTGKKKDTIIYQNNGSSNVTITEKILSGDELLSMMKMHKGKSPIPLSISDEDVMPTLYKGKSILSDLSFSFVKNNYPVTLPPGGKDTTIIQFEPLTSGVHSAILTIKSTDINAPVQILHLVGNAVGTPEISAEISAIKFDTLFALKSSKTASLLISNKGNLNLYLWGKFIEGDDRYNFSILSGSSPVIISPGTKDTMVISFNSYNTVGAKSARLYLLSDDMNNPVYSIDLSGFIKAAIINPTGRVLYGEVKLGIKKDSIATITNDGNVPLVISNTFIDGPQANEFTFGGIAIGDVIQPNQSVTVSASFKPSALGTRYCRIALFSNDGLRPEASIVLRGSGVILPPNRPVLVSPANGTTGAAKNPALTWNRLEDATSYRLVVSKDSLFNTNVLDKDDLTENTYTLSGLETGMVYFWRVSAKNSAGSSEWSVVWKFATAGSNAPLAINDNQAYLYALNQNYPNPFNPSTSIRFSLSQAGSTTIKVYNVIGKEVTTLLDKYLEKGEYSITFNASNLPSGIYYYKMQSGNYKDMKKMMLVK